jgi:hypothetical protein
MNRLPEDGFGDCNGLKMKLERQQKTQLTRAIMEMAHADRDN